MLAVAKRTWLVVILWPKGPCELEGGWVIKKTFEGTGFEDDGTCEGM